MDPQVAAEAVQATQQAGFVEQVFSPQVAAMCSVIVALVQGLLKVPFLQRFWASDLGDWLLGVLPFLLCALGAWVVPGIVDADATGWEKILFGGLIGGNVSLTIRTAKRGANMLVSAASSATTRFRAPPRPPPPEPPPTQGGAAA